MTATIHSLAAWKAAHPKPVPAPVNPAMDATAWWLAWYGEVFHAWAAMLGGKR